MATLLEFREKIRLLYVKVEPFFIPVIRFLVALIVLNTVNGRLGYMTRIDNTAIVLIPALMCSFLPTGAVLLFAALFSLLHMYALSIEVLAVGLVVYLLIYLLYLRFAPKESLVVALTPLLLCWKLPCVVPILMGLIGTPASAISVACGVLAYAYLTVVVNNAAAINAMDSEDAITRLKLVVDALLANKQMLVFMVAFAITVILVYVLRRLAIAHAWTIAIAAGAVTDLVVLLVGDMIYDTGVSFGSLILSTLVAVAVAKILEFFQFCLDYNRTERVQFEDDEYYYYVKAVPKLTVSKSDRRVKRINRQTSRTGSSTARSSARYTEEAPTYYEDGEGYGDEGYTDDTYYEDETYTGDGSADGYYSEDGNNSDNGVEELF